MFRQYQHKLLINCLLFVLLAACNKDIPAVKAVNVTIRGYNVSNSSFEVSIDTTEYKQRPLHGNGVIGFSYVYPYVPDQQQQASFRVKDRDNGNTIMQQPLDFTSGQLEFFYPLVYLGDRLLEVTPPPADAETNKLGFYIHYPQSDDLIDIFMYNAGTGQIAYLAKEVTPQTWVYADYIPEAGFSDKNELSSCIVYFTKTGTTDQWAFDNDEYLSQDYATSMFIPHKGHNLNKVQPYFVTPSHQGWRADVVALFPTPKNY
jgi:hypothetical protein